MQEAAAEVLWRGETKAVLAASDSAARWASLPAPSWSTLELPRCDLVMRGSLHSSGKSRRESKSALPGGKENRLSPAARFSRMRAQAVPPHDESRMRHPSRQPAPGLGQPPRNLLTPAQQFPVGRTGQANQFAWKLI